MNTHPAAAPARGLWWPPLFIFGAACAFCWPVFLGRLMLPADMCLLMLPWQALQRDFPDFHRVYNPMFDPIQQYLPWRIYAVDSLRAGFIPLWNPYSFCGAPFLANLQSTVLYPLNALFLLSGARHGFGVSAILHLTLGGLFMYAFLRTLGMRAAAALLGALILMFNGFTVTWLEYPTLSSWVFMWLPAILLCYERSLRAPRSLWPLLCSLAVGMQFLGGHLQISTYVVIAFLIYALVRLIGARAAGYSRRLAVLLALLPLALGLALAAGQILPTLELARETGRVSHTASDALRTAFPLTHLVLYLVPNFFGNPVHYNYWGNLRDPAALNFFETACYVGILPLLLAVCALRRWRQPELWFFGGLTAFAVLAAVGSPVYLALYYLVPGLRELAGLGRVLCLAAFGLAGLAALGLDDLLGDDNARRLRAPLLCAIVAVAAVLAAVLRFAPDRARLPTSWAFHAYLTPQVIAALLLLAASALLVALRARLRLRSLSFAWLAMALAALDLFGFGLRFNPFVDPRMAYPDMESTLWLQKHAQHSRVTSLASAPQRLDWMAHNSSVIFALRDIHGSDSLRLRRSFELVAGPALDQANYPPPDSPLMDTLGVRYLVTRRTLSYPWKLVHDAEAPIYENTRALPRAYLQRVGQEPWAPKFASGGRRRLASCPDGSASFERDDPDAIALKVTTSRPAQLTLTDSYYPGWRASVDGKSAPIYRVNYAFRGIPVSAGKHTVELRYEPATFRVGLFLSLLALAALAAAAISRLVSPVGQGLAPAQRASPLTCGCVT